MEKTVLVVPYWEESPGCIDHYHKFKGVLSVFKTFKYQQELILAQFHGNKDGKWTLKVLSLFLLQTSNFKGL